MNRTPTHFRRYAEICSNRYDPLAFVSSACENLILGFVELCLPAREDGYMSAYMLLFSKDDQRSRQHQSRTLRRHNL
jgi:hypothetical protein